MKLLITLKQHTPLIHFQWNQSEVTLRASEVKPKLDRFLLTVLGNGNYEQGKKNVSLLWLVGKGHNEHYALDYKMSIRAKGLPQEYLIASGLNTRNLSNNSNVFIISQSPYFAQEKEYEKVVTVTGETKNLPPSQREREFVEDKWQEVSKKGLLWSELDIEFFSVNDEIIKFIKENIISFFVCTNFGTCSNKGFGSFSVSKIVGEKEEKSVEYESVLAEHFNFVYSKCISDTGNKFNKQLDLIFRIIKSDYQKLKAGVNLSDKYTKSILFCYAIEKMKGHPRWEKRFFKQTLNPDKSSGLRPLGKSKLLYTKPPIADEKGTMDWKKYDCQFIRAVLGLAEQYEFLLRDGEHRIKEKAKVKVKSSEIERFPSPLLFKVIDNKIFLVGNKIDRRILNQVFTFSYFKDKVVLKKEGKDLENSLNTPNTFDLENFIRYAMDSKQQHHVDLGYTKKK
ncbi:hypothetical protein [Odoribacter splanchnicus]|uniref:hypothetical protein n=1 Tax=Odoribacter splanchnicus TaxID=28118 RepID=UPI0034B3AEB0